MELLSPAGGLDSLKAAVINGADAVYFGGLSFNARINATNFSDDELARAIDYCHERNVKAYITLNTLIYNRELNALAKYISHLYEIGTDALIVQDLATVNIINSYFPLLPIHASTQMGICSAEGAQVCKNLGFSRAVLSRETPFDEIARIRATVDMPLEVFVHGAMCVSFSGACLFSAMVGKRSGNRGECAQPCRKQMCVNNKPTAHDCCLSMADMCMLENIKDLRTAGVCSLKVEGRMKKPEYVACVTHAYRRAFDGADADELAELKKQISAVFNRGEHTTGYYYGDNARTDRIAKAAPSDELLSSIKESMRNDIKSCEVKLQLDLCHDKPAVLIAETAHGTYTVSGPICQTATSEPNKSRYIDALKKLGDTPLFANDITVSIDNAFIPVSAVNSMRREAVSRVLDGLHVKRKTIDAPGFSFKKHATDYAPIVSARVLSTDDARFAINCGANEIVFDAEHVSPDELKEFARGNTAVVLSLPPAIIGLNNLDRYQTIIASAKDAGCAVEINNIGQLPLCNGVSRIYGGIHMNVTNSLAVNMLEKSGLSRVTLSNELNAAQSLDITNNANISCAIQVYGRTVLMNLFHCPVKEHVGCKNCTQNNTLFDADGRAFPLLSSRKEYASPCMFTRLLNCLPTDIIPQAVKVAPAVYSLYFTTESKDIIAERIGATLRAVSGETVSNLPNTTRGYYSK